MNVAKLDISSDGGARFVLNYENPNDGEQIDFPFGAADISNLVYSPPDKVRGVTLYDPLLGGAPTTTTRNMIGHVVTVTTNNKRQSFTGKLMQADETSLAIQTETSGVVVLRTEDTKTISSRELGSIPSLLLQLAGPTPKLSITGMDPSFTFSVHHNVTLFPMKDRMDGVCDSAMYTYAVLKHNYLWPVIAESLTLVETETRPPAEPMRMYAEIRASSAPSNNGTSLQTGAIAVEGPRRIGTVLEGGSVIAVGLTNFRETKCHFLATVDPTVSDDVDVRQEFVVRFHRKENDKRFILSGWATVTIDMDPGPEVAHYQLPTGFRYDAWSSSNSKRLYYNLGATQLCTARLCKKEGTSDQTNADDGTVVGQRCLVFSNTTPYYLPFKLYLRDTGSGNTITGVEFAPNKPLTPVLGEFVRETEGEAFLRDVKTLTVVIPPNSAEVTLELTVRYFHRTT